jgi:CubicO group peptidase (beta-lactamase class C family)
MRSVVEERIYATGAQLYVEHRGTEVLDGAWGDCAGRVITPDSLHSAFCATKPLMGLAVGLAADAGLLGLDDAVIDHVPHTWARPSVTVRQVLAHRAGLQKPSAAGWRMTHPDQRASLLPPPPVPTPVYSEISGWLLLAEALRSATGLDPGEFAATRLIDRLGLGRDVLITPDRALRALEDGRVRVPIGGLPFEVVPLLSEQLANQVAETSLAFGGLTSMRGLGRLYSAVGRVLRGEPVPGLPSPGTMRALLTSCGDPAEDPVLRRRCSFAGGFMTGLADHRVATRLSPEAVGQSAGLASCVGFCDPVHDLAIALYLNGSAMTAADIEGERMAIIDRVYAVLGAG